MGKLKGIKFTGSIGDLTAYEVRGSEDIILRTKSGASRKKIMTAPQYANTRRNIAEFGARSMAARLIMSSMHPQKPLADYNISGPLNALLRPVQVLDKVSKFGQRQVQLSKGRGILTGFSLNRKTPFESVVRSPVSSIQSRELHQAVIEIPELLPGINFFPAQLPYYSIQVVLGVVPDILFRDGSFKPPASEREAPGRISVETPWLPTAKTTDRQYLELSTESGLPDDQYNFVLSIGIKYGSPDGNGEIRQVKHRGSAKVLAVF